MKKLISNPIVLDIIKVSIIFTTLRLLNIFHKDQNNTPELLVFLIVVIGVKFFFRRPKVQL